MFDRKQKNAEIFRDTVKRYKTDSCAGFCRGNAGLFLSL